MSKKKSRRAPSPMEQGELDDESPMEMLSPEVQLEAEDSQFTPEEDDEEDRQTSEDEEEEGNRKDSPDRSEDDTLDIKPPQQNSGKRDKHKKKHKEDRRRERDKPPKEGERSRHSATKDVDKERPRERKDRDRVLERGNERDDFRQKEERRRLKSLKERERLERLERERHRIDRDRQRREHEHRDQLRKQEREKREREKERQERADKQRRKEDEKRRRERQKPDERQPRREKERRVESRGDERIVQRSRSPYDRDRRDKERDRYREREKDRGREKHDDRQRRNRRDESPVQEERNGASSNKDKGRQRRVEYEHREEEPENDHHDDEYQEESLSEAGSAAGESVHSAVASEAGSVSPASVESHTESEDTESDSHTESERQGEEQDRTPEYKKRSKFEDESEKESETESVHQSNEENDEDYLEETPPQSPVELKPQLPPYLPAIQGCRPVDEFQCLNRIEEGTYGVVYRAVDKKTGEVVALKKLKMEKEKEGFPITSLREINTLLKAQHVNIVTVREIVVGSNMDKIFIVMDYVEHDLKSLMESMKEPFITGEVKTLMIQLLRGVAHLHDNWIVHRDLKTSNLLLSHKGILKIGDFGLAREYGSPLKQYTPIVVTLWYRAPELLLGTKLYSVPIDIWSCGCIFAEFITRKPLFPGKSEIDQLNRIFKELGTPNEKIWSGVSELPAMKKCTFADHPYNQLRNRFGSIITERGFDLMNRFLTYNPERRITAEQALKHDYFVESPLPVDPSMFPTWPAKSEQPRRTHGNSPKPPSGGKAFSKLLGDDDLVAQSSGGFHLGTATKGASAAGAGFSLKFGP